MMNGIDISNWQGGLDINALNVDFAIMKATEGLGFVDGWCDGWVQQAKAKGIKWGFYHYANNNHPYDEARFFVENTRNYFGEGIPILDIEDSSILSWGDYADAFCHEVRDLTGVPPLVYCSASQLGRFSGYSLVDFCGLWVAGYPYPATWWTDEYCPYDVQPWSTPVIWQFTSSLRLNGYDGNLDGNIAYIDDYIWDKYANPSGQSQPNPQPEPQPAPQKSIDDVAFEVILGEYGNDDIRRDLLAQNGYDYDVIQNRVNEIYDTAYRVINGEFGNDNYRIEALTNAGYNYDCVQHVVNVLLS